MHPTGARAGGAGSKSDGIASRRHGTSPKPAWQAGHGETGTGCTRSSIRTSRYWCGCTRPERVDLHHPASRHGRRSRGNLARLPGPEVAKASRLAQPQRRHRPRGLGAALALARPQPDRLLVRLSGDSSLADRARAGCRKKGRTPTRYHAESSLDQPIERDQDGKARHPAIKGRGVRLDEYVSWTSPSQSLDRSAKQAAAKELRNPDPDSQPSPPAPEMPNDG